MQDAGSRGPGFARAFPKRTGFARRVAGPIVSALALAGIAGALVACGGSDDDKVEKGQRIFRFDTFGDEAKWTDTLRMHEVISSAVDPTTALSVGLKVDSEALPAAVVQGIQNGSVDLKSPATTVTLLKLDAVVGLKGTVESVGATFPITSKIFCIAAESPSILRFKVSPRSRAFSLSRNAMFRAFSIETAAIPATAVRNLRWLSSKLFRELAR